MGITHELTGHQTGVELGSLSHFRASQMPVNQSAVKITPRTYIAETRTPDAMTASWSTEPAYSAHGRRPTYPASTRATIAMAPQTAAAVPAPECPSTLA